MFNELLERNKQNGWDNSYSRFLRSGERLSKFREKRLSFGVDFLDQALGGILPDDLVLIGAPSGVGKTGFVTNIAQTNVLQGKRVHLIALEAYEGEIEDRIHYNLLAEKFYADKKRKAGHLNYRGWIDGRFDNKLEKYHEDVSVEMHKLQNLNTFYKSNRFTIQDFVREMSNVAADTDLVILDHVHYFDIDDTNENRGFKEIVKTIRTVTQETGIPVVLVSHLRKKDRNNPELVAGIDEFHGSSDLTKIATKVISIGKGEMLDPYTAATYLRIPKMRMDGSVTFYTALLHYSFKTGTYLHDKSKLGILTDGGKKWEMLDKSRFPDWYSEL